MYDTTSDWGPSRHNPESPYSRRALSDLRDALVLRDDTAERPDDN